MDNDLLMQRERMKRFNEWESKHCRELSFEQRCMRFAELFSLQRHIEKDRLENLHSLHLENLISVQRRFKMIYERMKDSGVL
jgi:hypothetical protein